MIMKNLIKYIFQKILGFNTYLFIFSLYIIYTLRWNKNEKDFLQFMKLIKKDGAILDIGANIGVMTTYLAKSFRKSTIYSFEPIPYNLKVLKRIVKFFKLTNVKVMDFALGNENGTVEMVMPVINSVKMQGLSHVVHDSIDELNEGQKFTSNIAKLDDLKEISENEAQVIAIKIDVENFEYFVLEGGKELLRNHKPILYMELWENQNRTNCFKLLTELGYEINVLDNKKLTSYDELKHTTQNFFFTPAKFDFTE